MVQRELVWPMNVPEQPAVEARLFKLAARDRRVGTVALVAIAV